MRTHHPVRDLIASASSSGVLDWHPLDSNSGHIGAAELRVKMMEVRLRLTSEGLEFGGEVGGLNPGANLDRD